MTLVTIVLPWPSRVLHPNSRPHRYELAKARKLARRDGWIAAMEQTTRIQRYDLRVAGAVSVAMTFHPPDKRRRDDDGMVSAMKSHRDGIADAIGLDDVNWLVRYEISDPVPGGKVVVGIE